MKKTRPKQYEHEDDYSNIIGVGSSWGNVVGKVKTRQIGFVRQIPGTQAPRGTGRKPKSAK